MGRNPANKFQRSHEILIIRAPKLNQLGGEVRGIYTLDNMPSLLIAPSLRLTLLATAAYRQISEGCQGHLLNHI